MLFAFVQDVLQKNYAFCLRDERYMNETETETHRTGCVVKSHLTPFAFSFLVPLLRDACSTANMAMGFDSPVCGDDNLPRGRSARMKSHSSVGEFWSTRRSSAFHEVTRAVMIARMMCERTAHLTTSPLYVALTAEFPFSAEGQAGAFLMDRNGLMTGLQTLLLGVLTTFVDFHDGVNAQLQQYCSPWKWADVVTAVLPLVLTVVEAERAKALTGNKAGAANTGKASFTWKFRSVLLRVMRTVKNAIYPKDTTCSNNNNNSDATTLPIQFTAASYLLFAQASTLLVQLDTLGGALNSSNVQMECVEFLRDAIMVLAAGFCNRHVKELNDEETGRLLHGMECLLLSSLSLFGVQVGSDAEVTTTSTKKGRAGNAEETSEQRLLFATCQLHSALDVTAQQALVQTLLLEALASPVRSLRVVALRLLRLLCHPDVKDAERTAGCSAIDVSFFDALLNAELFDPLSSTGNLDGIRQALAKLTFDAAAGKVRDPFQRVVLARAMVGLLHTKFADAWPIALKILADLVRMEDTSLLPSLQQQRDTVSATAAGDNDDNKPSSSSSLSPSFSAKLEPLVWGGVVCRYARAIVFGDILQGATSCVLHDDKETAGDVSDDDDDDAFGPGDISVWYRIRLSDMQRHEKGELVSREFATARSVTSFITLLQLANADAEVLSWRRHYLPSMSPTHMHGALAARTTDRAVLAKTFLSGLSEMTHGAPGDGRALLLTELVLELSAVRRGEHPSGVQQLKMLDERLVLAMNACSATPISSSQTSARKAFPSDVRARFTACNEQLQRVCVGLLSDSNAKLQRAAIDQLKRLKVTPFSRCHAQLIPYCDTQQNLFNFLATFHIESDVPREDSAEYIATVLAIALPRLTAKVSKEKLKDQAILQRRVLSLVTHLTASEEFATVLEGLVQRLIFDRVMFAGSMEPAAMRFTEMWAEWVQNNNHGARRLERLVKQLLGTLQLLAALLQAVGRGFASFAGSCLHLALNAYLVSSKQILRAPLGPDALLGTEANRRIHAALTSKTLNMLLSKLRRSAAGMVASLHEQFPAEVMTTLRKDLAEVATGDVRQSLMGRYLSVLIGNSNTAIPELVNDHRGAENHQTGVTPSLRLVRAWAASPITMPLIGAFGDVVTAMFQQVFAYNAAHTAVGTSSAAATLSALPQQLRQAAMLSVYEALRCVSVILASATESFDAFGASGRATLQELYVEPHVMAVFGSLYQLIVRGASLSFSSSANARVAGSRRRRKSSFTMAFSVPIWKEMIATVTMLSQYVVSNAKEAEDDNEVDIMLSRLLEMCIAFVAHPTCAKERQTCITATNMLEGLLPRLRRVGFVEHYEPLVRLLNVVTNPEARLSLCRSLSLMLQRLVYPADSDILGDNVRRCSPAHAAQLAAVSRAVNCLNSFAEGNTNLERYDFELRFHTFRSLHKFFYNDGNYGALSTKRQRAMEAAAEQQQVRQERDYSGAADVTLPLDKTEAPVLCIEAFLVLTSNVVFFLRDSEGTIRALALQLLNAMLLYASRQKDRATSYHTLILERVIRRELLPSLRRGIAARDVHIRHAHMQGFGALAQHYSVAFPSFALLHSRNSERCFFANVAHVQHRCRLKALEILRQNVGRLLPRDVLRVFVPFLLLAVKDFAQGKRDLQNLTEGRAKGYCDSVLTTLAAVAAALPWEGYYHLLSLLILNARENLSLRLPMLRGVVMLLDHFHFLDDDHVRDENEGSHGNNASPQVDDEDEDDDDDDAGEEKNEAAKELRAKRLKYRHARVIHVMEDDVLPQLYEFLGSKSRKGYPLDAELRGNVHTIAAVRNEMRGADNAQQQKTILQLPVAIAITKIVKHFSPDRFSLHVEHLLDEVVLKLRTKSDKHRESARRILSAMLWETGPGKLAFVIRKLKDHFVHGYQLHVLGYTVVTLLYNLYEPQHAISFRRKKVKAAGKTTTTTAQEGSVQHQPNDEDEDDNGEKRVAKEEKNLLSGPKQQREKDEAEAEAEAEEELVRQLAPASTRFDHAYGVSCLTACLDDLMSILLDDYLGEVGEQKEQVELMSTMVEVKRNRALPGFTLIASHCEASRVIEVFLQKITWLLTPPSEATTVDIGSLRGSARAAALMLQEFKTKYSTISKNAAADLVFVKKVRLLAVRVARALLRNATMEVEGSFRTVCNLLQKHNEVREAKIRAFEIKDGTRRVRGNVHMTIQRAPTQTRKKQLDENFLVAPCPERVDVDFSTHTVLATQQKQKLRVYRGRYGKELQQAAKDFYREDPATAVVLDTLDEFLLKYLLSVLKKVLGIGRGGKHTAAAVRLDLLRAEKKKRLEEMNAGNGDENIGDEDGVDGESQRDNEEENDESDSDVDGSMRSEGEEEEEEEEEEDDGLLEPQPLDDEEDDALDRFATEAQQDEYDNNVNKDNRDGKQQARNTGRQKKRRPMADLTLSFMRQHQQLLESLVPVVLTTLQGEGNDAVVSHALDCLVAFVSLRPPLNAVRTLHTSLFDTITAFFERGKAIKQRAMRATAAVVAHQQFTLTDEQASQLTRMCHAELVDGNEFVPMALALFHVVLGKHTHVVEVYDMIGVVTELMMHRSAKRVMRQRCIAILVRFLTEYRMTPEKFRSHIDLFCRNLDYPEVTGRIAILELIASLTYRLPTAVLRQEAAFLLMPIAVTLAASEYYEARRKAGDVLQGLVKNAGLDVLVPTLVQWLAADQTRPRKEMALQAWAVMIPAVAASYDMGDEEDAREFGTCCAWSVQAVLDAATHDQMAASSKKRKHEEPAAALKRKLELKGWAYVFFALRCVEGMATAAPAQVWQNTALVSRLVPWLSGRLILHSHPWIQSVALRLMRLYCHNGVERECGYLREIDWATEMVNLERTTKKKLVSKNKKRTSGEESTHEQTTSSSSSFTVLGDVVVVEHGPYVVRFRNAPGPLDSIPRALEALDEMSSTLQTLLQFISLSDVPNEKYSAHRAMEQPSRADAVSVALYLTRAMMVVSVVLLYVAVFRSGAGASHVQDAIARHFTSIRHHLHALATPAIKHDSVVNVMVRSASLVQYFGGLLAALPNVTPAGGSQEEIQAGDKEEGDGEKNDHDVVSTGALSSAEAAVCWLARNAIGLEFIQKTMVPTLVVAMHSEECSEKLSGLAGQASVMLREQLSAHRPHFAGATTTTTTTTTKRVRLESEGSRQQRRRGDGDDERPCKLTVDDVLFALTTETTAVRNTRKEKITRREATKSLRKRSRASEMAASNQQRPQQRKRRV